MVCAWKSNWPETRQHFLEWWQHKGLVLLTWWNAPPADPPHEDVPPPPPMPPIDVFYTSPELRAQFNHYALAHQNFPADTLPIANTDLGPGSLALFIGSEPGFDEHTVWFKPSPAMRDDAGLEDLPPLRFDPENRWWRLTEDTLKACVKLGRGKYFVGCPDLIENIDIVAALRRPQVLLMDMIERPDWVSQKVTEINQVWFEAYERVYEIIKTEDGGAVFGAFALWGPGKVAKVQCDTAAMFSPAMFDQFVVPALTEQCEWLDFSMFHLDGAECIRHLDSLLAIESLDAIEWTPNPKVPSGGDPAWYEMYRRILDAGKSVQAIGVKAHEVLPLLDAVGGEGMYIMTSFESEAQADALLKQVEAYR